MPLMSFSEKKHIELILSGEKAQTTRKPRKNPIKDGGILYCYFKPRMKKSCKNCISGTCKNSILNNHMEWPVIDCMGHINKFGTAKVTCLKHVTGNARFKYWNIEDLDEWAKLDGFEDIQEADEWFTRVHGPDWREQDWTIIYFEGDWLPGIHPGKQTTLPEVK